MAGLHALHGRDSIPVPFVGLRQVCDSRVGARSPWLCAQHLHLNCARRRSILNAQNKTGIHLNFYHLLSQTTQHVAHLLQVVTGYRIAV